MTGAEVIVETKDATYTNAFNVGLPATDVDAQEARLSTKFDALVIPCLGAEKAETLKAMALSGEADPKTILAVAR